MGLQRIGHDLATNPHIQQDKLNYQIYMKL